MVVGGAQTTMFQIGGDLADVFEPPGKIVQEGVLLEFFACLEQDLSEFTLLPGCRLEILFTEWFWAKPHGR